MAQTPFSCDHPDRSETQGSRRSSFFKKIAKIMKNFQEKRKKSENRGPLSQLSLPEFKTFGSKPKSQNFKILATQHKRCPPPKRNADNPHENPENTKVSVTRFRHLAEKPQRCALQKWPPANPMELAKIFKNLVQTNHAIFLAPPWLQSCALELSF